MSVPNDRKYLETHEWFQVDGDVVTIGITQHAATELTDITFVDLPKVGARFSAGDVLGEIESVKATAEFYTAVSGEVVEINEELAEHPEYVNDDAFEAGWMVRVRADDLGPLEKLLTGTQYDDHVG